jgi:hypothetical protein
MIIILCSLTGGLIYYSYKKIYGMADYSLRDIMLLFNIGFGMLAAKIYSAWNAVYGFRGRLFYGVRLRGFVAFRVKTHLGCTVSSLG